LTVLNLLKKALVMSGAGAAMIFGAVSTASAQCPVGRPQSYYPQPVYDEPTYAAPAYGPPVYAPRPIIVTRPVYQRPVYARPVYARPRVIVERPWRHHPYHQPAWRGGVRFSIGF
jgi:hypothetical protein